MDDPALKSVFKKKRTNVQRRRKLHQPVKTTKRDQERNVHKSQQCEIVAQHFTSDVINEILNKEEGSDCGKWLERVASAEQNLLSKMEDLLLDSNEDKDWCKNLSNKDLYHICREKKQLDVARNTILKLPKLLDKLYDISTLELMSKRYRRDHLWLTLQWEIDGVENPFLARPCSNASTCLGKYIPCIMPDTNDDTKPFVLPEITPLKTLDSYRIARYKGQSTEEFTNCLQQKIQCDEPMTGAYVWSEPRCALCHMQDIFTKTMNPLYKMSNITKDNFVRNFSFEFPGMLPHYSVDSQDVNFAWCLTETNVLISQFSIPLVGLIVANLQRNQKEIIVSRLYDRL
jgi:hypothetical protein